VAARIAIRNFWVGGALVRGIPAKLNARPAPYVVRLINQSDFKFTVRNKP
jgi:hypothetical protein